MSNFNTYDLENKQDANYDQILKRLYTKDLLELFKVILYSRAFIILPVEEKKEEIVHLPRFARAKYLKEMALKPRGRPSIDLKGLKFPIEWTVDDEDYKQCRYRHEDRYYQVQKTGYYYLARDLLYEQEAAKWTPEERSKIMHKNSILFPPLYS